MTPFAQLHNHTGFSLIDGLARIPAMVAAAQKDGHVAVAATDHGGLGGWFALHKATVAAREDDPSAPFAIYGAEFYLAYGPRSERDSVQFNGTEDEENGSGDKHNYHLTLLAANEAGYRNLIVLNNLAHEHFWHKPRIDVDLLAEHGEGVIVMTGCLGGPVTSHLAHGDREGASANLATLVAAVGADNVYVELMEHGVAQETAILPELVALAKEHGCRWVVTNDGHFVDESDELAHEAWLLVGNKKGTTLKTPGRWRFPGKGYWFRTEAQMRAARTEDWWQTGCDETGRIAERIGGDVMPDYPLRLPKFPAPEGFADSPAYLRHLVREGAFKRYGEDPNNPGRLPDAVNKRLRTEFAVIEGAGMCDYFLIVWDMLKWARSQGIMCGPGRGSGAGSCIAYCLDITRIEPLSHGLLFERFLNPERVGLPDFDVDFEKARAQEVVDHLRDMYGADSVARIGTRGIVRSRQAIKDAARILGLDTRVGSLLAPLVPVDGGKPRPLKTLLDPSKAEDPAAQAFLKALATVPEGQELAELALRFEGVPRSESIHACGVVVSSEPLLDLVPLRRATGDDVEPEDGEERRMITGWEGPEIEAAGFVKMDVLSIRNLDVVSQTAKFIQETTGEYVDVEEIDPDNITDVERDAAAWALIAEGRTEGVFQLESAQMTDLAMDVKPTCLEDVTALVALYRPGPMAAGAHTAYAARKNGRETVSYDKITTNPAERAVIAEALDRTLALPVYQEQLMELGGLVGGLGAGMRNKLQKAFSKKKKDLMDEVKTAMFAGGLAGAGPAGVKFSQQTLENLWNVFEGSASYLFNKSHAAAYGRLAYVTAYAKANWPVEYGAALLATTDKDDKRAGIIRSLVRQGIPIHAPDINVSKATTTVDAKREGIHLGMSEIKGVGKIAYDIVAQRDADGPYRSITDFMARVHHKDAKGKTVPITVAAVEALIEAGALDAFGSRKGQLRALRAARLNPTIVDQSEWGAFERSQRQRARTGVTLGDHPLSSHAAAVTRAIKASRWESWDRTSVRALLSDAGVKRVVVVPGIVTSWAEKSYSKGRMANFTLEGSGGEQAEVVVWDAELTAMYESATVPHLGSPVMVQARVETRTFSREVTAEDGTVSEEESVRLSMSARAIESLIVDDGGVSANFFDDDLLFPPRRSDRGASVVVRALPRRAPAADAAMHRIPLESLVNTGPRAWVRANPATGRPVVLAVAAGEASLEDMRSAMDGVANLGAPGAYGWAEIEGVSSETF